MRRCSPVRTLKESDTIVPNISGAILKAQPGSTPGFEIKEYDNYTKEVTHEFQSRFRNEYRSASPPTLLQGTLTTTANNRASFACDLTVVSPRVVG